MRRLTAPQAAPMASIPFLVRHRRHLAAFTLACFTLTSVSPVFAGGYVDGNVVLNPAKAINIGGVSVTPTFNNDQFNDQLLVGTVNNDPVRTPSTADPVSTVSGNNYHDETDFVIRGRNGLNTVFTRTYNSAPSSTKVDRGLGYGWTHSYLMRLKSNDFGDCPNCTSAQKPENANGKTSSITYTDERGGEQAYLINETTYVVTAPKGVYDMLTLDSPAAGQHTLAFRNGVKYIFETPTGTLKTTPNVVARLKYIDNAWGDRLTLAYDANGRLSTITDNLGISGRTGITFTYHPDGRLKDVTDWTGRKWSYAYDASGNLQTMTNPLSQVLTYAYDAPKHLLTSIAKPLQRDGQTVQTQFKYYENGRAFQQTNSFGVGDTLDYDLYRKSTRVTDARGYVREYFYDDNGRMTQLKEPDGGVLWFENQGDAIRSKKYDALGYATTYSYRLDRALTGASDAHGNVTREQDALNRTVDLTYGPLDQVASVKDKRGATSTTTFATATSGCDYTNRPKETRISALSGSTNVLLASLCWNGNATLNYSRQYLDASRYRETRLTYEAASNGLNVSQEQIVGMPSGITVTKAYTYDSLGRKKTETLKRRTSPTNAALINLATSYDYDALDRVIKATDSLGNEVVNSYDANGQLWKVTHRFKKPDASYDVRDVITRTFDAADRVKTETDAEGNTTTYSYDPAGNVIAVLDAEGHTTRFEYDAMNRRTAVIDATGYRTETAYTLRGDVVGIKNANGEKVTFEVDALGRKTAMVDPLGHRTEYAYDENGNLVCLIDANAQAGLQPKNAQGCTETRQYDELNRLTKSIDAGNGETAFTYDLLGNRLTVKDAENKTWAFAYDDLGRLKSETDHSAKTIGYKPDEAGNVYEKTNRLNETTRYTFDTGNRLTRVDYLKDGTFETFGYDAAGNRNAAANANVSYAFAWDRLNRLTQKTDSRGRALNFTYDTVGNVLTKTTYQGSTTRYVYNAANRLVMLQNPDYTQVDYQYDPAGRLLSRVTANGVHTNYGYDAAGRMTRLTQYDAADALVSDTSYTRDRLGNLLTATDGAGTTTYAYDPIYRLKTADYPGAANDELFTWDQVGNRKTYTKGSLTANGNTRYYSYQTGTNHIQNIRVGSPSGAIESAFAWDDEGRLTSQTGLGAKTLTWDAKGRLWSLTNGTGTEVYDYDPMDYRIGRSGGLLGNLDYFLEGEHLESTYQSGVLKEKFFRGASTDELVAAYLTDTDGKMKPFLFHHDQVNSVSAVSGHNGGVTQSLKYQAFGETQSSTGTSPSRLKYTGREEDGTGLYYFRARYLDPGIGFISEDPIGFAGGINQYQYAGSNAVNFNDPTGHVAETPWDLFNVGLGSYSLTTNIRDGNWGWAAVDAVGLAYDTVATAVPFLPAGVSAGIAALRAGNTIQNSVQVGMDVAKVANVANDAARAASTTGRAVDAGRVIHNQVGDTINSTNMLSSSANNFFKGANGATGRQPDLSWSDASGVWADLTTPRQWGQHVSDYSQSFGEGIPLLYERGQGLVDTLRLTSGASTGLTALQFGTSNAFGGQSAGGGFLLYPNKSNTNMMQSVYQK